MKSMAAIIQNDQFAGLHHAQTRTAGPTQIIVKYNLIKAKIKIQDKIEANKINQSIND